MNPSNTQPTLFDRILQHPLINLLVGVAVALFTAILIVVVGLQPPQNDIWLLLIFMGGTGFTTVSLAYWFYEQGVIRQFSSLRWTLLISIGITILLVLLMCGLPRN